MVDGRTTDLGHHTIVHVKDRDDRPVGLKGNLGSDLVPWCEAETETLMIEAETECHGVQWKPTGICTLHRRKLGRHPARNLEISCREHLISHSSLDCRWSSASASWVGIQRTESFAAKTVGQGAHRLTFIPLRKQSAAAFWPPCNCVLIVFIRLAGVPRSRSSPHPGCFEAHFQTSYLTLSGNHNTT